MTYTLLSSDDPRIAALIDGWPDYYVARFSSPRSMWLKACEAILRELHPSANSDSLTYTARQLAPFPLAKPGVP